MTSTRPIPFIPKTQADALALEIAREFGDEVRLSFYRQVCSAHTHAIVYRAFRAAQSTPPWRIKKSRRALFIYLIHKYEEPS